MRHLLETRKDLENDSLRSVWARVKWLHALWRFKSDEYFTKHDGKIRIAVGLAVLVFTMPVAWKLDGIIAGRAVAAVATDPQPTKAWVQIVVMLVVMIVAMILAYAMAPKPKQPEMQKGRAPVADEGKSIIRIYGTVWIEDAMVLAFKTMGAVPIVKKSGGK